MKSTKYYYGVKPKKYAIIQIALCTEKIKDSRKLLLKLKPKVKLLSKKRKHKFILKRVLDIQGSIKDNQYLIEEAKGLL